jgi:hypothetical protein
MFLLSTATKSRSALNAISRSALVSNNSVVGNGLFSLNLIKRQPQLAIGRHHQQATPLAASSYANARFISTTGVVRRASSPTRGSSSHSGTAAANDEDDRLGLFVMQNTDYTRTQYWGSFAVFAVIVTGAALYFINDERKSTRPYKLAMVYLRHSPELRAVLGEPIDDYGYWVNTKRSGNQVCMSTAVHGPNGDGKASFCATFKLRSVELTRMHVDVHKPTPQTIDIDLRSENQPSQLLLSESDGRTQT